MLMAETPMTRVRTITTPTIEPPRGRPVAWLLLASLPMLAFLLLPLVALLLRIPLVQLLANLANPEVAQAISLSIITTGLTVELTPITPSCVRRMVAGISASPQ
jgi:molybdate transport system permease protein